jgi:hypothetical protein
LERKIQEYEYEHQCSQTITDDLKYGVLVTGQLAKQQLMRTSWRLCTWGEARHELWGDRGWVGKMCCKAPGGKYMENQFRKVEEWKGFVLNFEQSKSGKSRKVRGKKTSRKVEKYTF